MTKAKKKHLDKQTIEFIESFMDEMLKLIVKSSSRIIKCQKEYIELNKYLKERGEIMAKANPLKQTMEQIIKSCKAGTCLAQQWNKNFSTLGIKWTQYCPNSECKFGNYKKTGCNNGY